MKIVIGIALVTAVVVAAVIAASARWNRATAAHAAGLEAGVAATALYSEGRIAALPAPAARYFRRALREGQPIATSAVATQDAEFFLNGAWRPLTATQRFTTNPPGFVWDARIAMAPLVSAFVRDSYVNGSASMTASVLGLYTLVDQHGAPELNSGALQRFLGEAVWMPTALLPSDRLTWAARDGNSAIATLRDAGNEVSLVFEFDQEGRVVSISGDRFKEHSGSYLIQPWIIRCTEHALRDGMLIPLRCEVSWMNNGVAEPYWRGRISSITYAYQ